MMTCGITAFYEEDMVHPSAQAVDYIWGKFTEFAMDPDTRALLPRLGKLDAALHQSGAACGQCCGGGLQGVFPETGG